jgi:hypothetical protein
MTKMSGVIPKGVGCRRLGGGWLAWEIGGTGVANGRYPGRTVFVDGKHAPSPAEARLHLVCDEKYAVLVTEAAKLTQVAGRVGIVAALALDGLEENGTSVLGARLLLRVEAVWKAVGVGE